MNETVSSVGFGGLGERLGTACGEEEFAREKLREKAAKVARFFPPSQAPPFFWKKPRDFGARNERFFPFSRGLSLGAKGDAARVRRWFREVDLCM